MKKILLIVSALIILSGCTKKVTEQIVGPSPNIQTFEFTPKPNDFTKNPPWMITTELQVDGLTENDIVDVYMWSNNAWLALPCAYIVNNFLFFRDGEKIVLSIYNMEFGEIIIIPEWYKFRVDVYFVE